MINLKDNWKGFIESVDKYALVMQVLVIRFCSIGSQYQTEYKLLRMIAYE